MHLCATHLKHKKEKLASFRSSASLSELILQYDTIMLLPVTINESHNQNRAVRLFKCYLLDRQEDGDKLKRTRSGCCTNVTHIAAYYSEF